jgi:hypothetical protein
MTCSVSDSTDGPGILIFRLSFFGDIPTSLVSGSPGATVTSSGFRGSTFAASVLWLTISGPVEVTLSLDTGSTGLTFGSVSDDLGGAEVGLVVANVRDGGSRVGTGGRNEDVSADSSLVMSMDLVISSESSTLDPLVPSL